MLGKMILSDIEMQCDLIDPTFLRQKRVLVTGASGLVGTYILAYLAMLVQRQIPMKIYAQIYSDPPDHLVDLIGVGQINVLKMNLADITDYQRIPDVDIVIHCAGYAQPTLFMSNPVATIQVNVSATAALMQHLSPGGSFLFISSSEVYCGLLKKVFQETDIGTTTPYHPRASYIEGKRGGEAICAAFRSQGARAISVRLCDVYGPGTRKHDKRALNTFIEKALLNGKIDLLDSGSAVRTYCYISDALEILLSILFVGKHPVYNLGGRSPVRIAELAEMIGTIAHVPVVFPENAKPISGAPEFLQMDLTRVETEFGKSKYVDLEAGLGKTISWQRQLYGMK